MATARQIAANRRNAEKSTGPTSDEGKERSRANAWKHGLAGEGVVVLDDDAEAVARREDDWRPAYRPATEQDEWLFRQVVVSSVRVDRCQRQESALRADLARRATLCWDDDRRLDAEELGAGLAKQPGLVGKRLRRTKHGCEWLIGRWRALGRALEASPDGTWTEDQETLAHDLLGTPSPLRDRDRQTPPWGHDGSAAELVAREVEDLSRLRDGALDEIDAADRDAAEAGREVAESRALGLIRRYEAACLRRLEWARKLLIRPAGAADPGARAAAPWPPVRGYLPGFATPPAPFPTRPEPAPAPADVDHEMAGERSRSLDRLIRVYLDAPTAAVVDDDPTPTPARPDGPDAGAPAVPNEATAPRPNRRARRAALRLAARRR